MKTRRQMEEILGRKESVLYNGRSITRVEDLPTEEELAAGDEAAQARIADSIEEQIRRLEARRDKLNAVKAAPAPVAPAPVQAPEPSFAAPVATEDVAREEPDRPRGHGRR